MKDIEEIRRKRIAENQKRINELQLHKLSHHLKIHPCKPKKQENKVRNKSSNVVVISVRRSNRNSLNPPPTYNEFALGHCGLGRPKSYKISCKREPMNDFIASAEEKACSIERADYLVSTLGSQFPTCVRLMYYTYLAIQYSLPLPPCFCRDHMPHIDALVMLMDENERQWELKYVAHRRELSSGWRTFSVDHQLRDGDALVFQLIEPTTFKVYIIRLESFKQEQDKGRLRSDDDTVNAKELRGRKGTKSN